MLSLVCLLSQDLFCTLFVFVFGQIVGSNICLRPNSDIHIYSVQS